MTIQFFEPHNNEEHTQTLANLLPNDDSFLSKNIDASNFRRLLSVFAPEMARFEESFLEVSREIDINQSNIYLSRWEKSLGIPDECFPGTGTLEERRLNVIIKLACMNVSTEKDFEDLGLKLGFEVDIVPGDETGGYPYTYPFLYLGPLDNPKFVMVIKINALTQNVGYPYTYPFTYQTSAIQILKCVYNKIKPANVLAIFEEI